jgi:hypothetical protein
MNPTRILPALLVLALLTGAASAQRSQQKRYYAPPGEASARHRPTAKARRRSTMREAG